jgi:hypothetical protein
LFGQHKSKGGVVAEAVAARANSDRVAITALVNRSTELLRSTAAPAVLFGSPLTTNAILQSRPVQPPPMWGSSAASAAEAGAPEADTQAEGEREEALRQLLEATLIEWVRAQQHQQQQQQQRQQRLHATASTTTGDAATVVPATAPPNHLEPPHLPTVASVEAAVRAICVAPEDVAASQGAVRMLAGHADAPWGNLETLVARCLLRVAST